MTVTHSEANAVSEKNNTSIKSTIKSLMAEGYTFENETKIHESIYNSSFHNTIQSSLIKILFGRELANITETLDLTIHQHRLDMHNDYYILMNNLKKLYDKICNNFIMYQKFQNSTQHTKMKLRRLGKGDIVFLDKSNKLKKPSQGSIEKCSEVIYKIQLQEDPSNI